MTTIDKEELDSLIQSEWGYLESKKGEWSLLRRETGYGSAGTRITLYPAYGPDP